MLNIWCTWSNNIWKVWSKVVSHARRVQKCLSISETCINFFNICSYSKDSWMNHDADCQYFLALQASRALAKSVRSSSDLSCVSVLKNHLTSKVPFSDTAPRTRQPSIKTNTPNYHSCLTVALSKWWNENFMEGGTQKPHQFGISSQWISYLNLFNRFPPIFQF